MTWFVFFWYSSTLLCFGSPTLEEYSLLEMKHLLNLARRDTQSWRKQRKTRRRKQEQNDPLQRLAFVHDTVTNHVSYSQSTQVSADARLVPDLKMHSNRWKGKRAWNLGERLVCSRRVTQSWGINSEMRHCTGPGMARGTERKTENAEKKKWTLK